VEFCRCQSDQLPLVCGRPIQLLSLPTNAHPCLLLARLMLVLCSPAAFPAASRVSRSCRYGTPGYCLCKSTRSPTIRSFPWPLHVLNVCQRLPSLVWAACPPAAAGPAQLSGGAPQHQALLWVVSPYEYQQGQVLSISTGRVVGTALRIQRSMNTRGQTTEGVSLADMHMSAPSTVAAELAD
jgi:hypothetical protein